MTFTHDDIKNRLIEFLYGELEGDARAAFDEHLAGCEGCRADVAGFQQTRAVARAAVRAGLDQPVPAGVRARVLEAAAVAATANGHAAPARVAAEAAKKLPKIKGSSKESSKGEASGPFAWLRARWTLPMFATVAAMGALLLVRETIYREARKPLGDTVAPEAPAPSVAPPAMPPLDNLKAAKAEADEAPAQVKKSERRPAPARGGAGSLSDDSFRAEARPTSAHKAGKASSASRKGSGSRAASAAAPSGTPVIDMDADSGGAQMLSVPKRNVDDLLEGAMKPSPRKEAVGAAEPRDRIISKQVDKSDTRGFAQPPPPPAPAAAAPMPRAPAAAPAAPRARAAAESTMSADDSADEAPRSEKKKAAKRPVADVQEEAAPAASRAPATAGSSDREEEDAPAPDPAAPLAARAERLMASQKWAEAAAAYRQLIARFPKHEQVPNWKRRLSVVEAAASRH